MSVCVVARIRPLLKLENERDVIVTTTATESGEPTHGRPGTKSNGKHTGSDNTGVIRIPNPKNGAEQYSFQFNSVYDHTASQQAVYDNEGKQAYLLDNWEKEGSDDRTIRPRNRMDFSHISCGTAS